MKEKKIFIEDTSIKGRKDEIQIKLKRIHKVLDENNLDAMYILKQEAFAWITAGGSNVVTRYSETGVTAILITRTGQYAICNNIEKQRMIDEEKLEQLGFEVISQEWYENRNLEIVKSIIGDNSKFASDVPIGDAIDANIMIAKMQYSLTDNEIARYQHLGKVYSTVLEETLAEMYSGISEIDVVGYINKALWKKNIDAVLYLVAGDERIYKYRHCIPTEKKVEKLMMVSCNARYKGLITKITRFVSFGTPSDDFIKQYEDTLLVENRMIAATKIGVDDLVPFQVAIDSYEELGYHDMWKEHHQGGPQGYTNGYYLISENSHDIVQPNQCYCYNPSITGTKSEDAFIVTEDGPILLTYPVSFPVCESIVDGISLKRPGILCL